MFTRINPASLFRAKDIPTSAAGSASSPFRRCCPQSASSRVAALHDFAHALRDRLARTKKIVEAENRNFEKTLPEIALTVPNRAQSSPRVPLVRETARYLRD